MRTTSSTLRTCTLRPSAAVGLGVFFYGLPALIVLFRAPRYVRDAQAAV